MDAVGPPVDDGRDRRKAVRGAELVAHARVATVKSDGSSTWIAAISGRSSGVSGMIGSSGSSAHGAGPVVDRSCDTAMRKRSNSSLKRVGSIDSVFFAN